MRTVVSSPGSGIYAQQVGLAFMEREALEAFVTTFVHDQSGILARILSQIPARASERMRSTLERRIVTLLPREVVKALPFWEILRVAASRAGASPVFVDRIWDHLSKDFDTKVAKRYLSNADAIYAYEYTALATFKKAHKVGVATILDLPSLNNRAFDEIQKVEKDKFPELRVRADTYFQRVFEQRQARREEEINLADVIVANSNLTKRSHVAAGADPDKFIVVPLAAPPAVDHAFIDRKQDRPLEVIWAGSFQIRKGAHYFLDAWRRLNAPLSAHAAIFGSVALPAGAMCSLPEGLSFEGSVPQSSLHAAFESADVLVFPTLSDGFGLVITEAFARGLPVITTHQAGAADLVRHGENGLIIPAGSTAAIYDALRWCLDNRNKLWEMRSAALETARRWQWSDYRKCLITKLDRALRRKGFDPDFGDRAPANESR